MTTSNIKSGKDEREWDKYFDLFIEYQKQYARNGYPNKKFALLYEIGSFWEIYGVDNGVDKIGNIREILAITNNNIGQKNKSDFNPKDDPMLNDRNHPLFGGFPFANQEDAESKLINAGYDLIYYAQTGEIDKDTDKKIRKYSRTVTPGSFIGELIDTTSCHMISIYINNTTKDSERIFKWKDAKLSIGMTSIDLTTNEATVYSAQSKEFDQMYSMNELFRFLQSMNPKEILLSVGNCNLQVELDNTTFQEFIKTELMLDKFKNVHQPRLVVNEFLREDYQEKMLKTVYPICNKSYNGFDTIGLSHESEIRISLIQLLDFVYKTDPKMLKHLHTPKLWSSVNHFTLTNNAIEQLEIDFPNRNSEKRSLLDIIDNTSTTMGKRLFRTTLLNPILSARKLEHRWNLVDLLYKENRWKIIEKPLSGIHDISKLYKRLCIQRLYPCELIHIHNSHLIINKLLDTMNSCEWGPDLLFIIDASDIEKFTEFIEYVDTTFDLEVLSDYHIYDINRSLFKKGIFPEIDTLQNKIDKALVSLDDFHDTITALCALDESKFKKPSVTIINRNRKNKKQPITFKMTKNRFALIELYLSKISAGQKHIHKWKSFKDYEKWLSKRKDESDDEKLDTSDATTDSAASSACGACGSRSGCKYMLSATDLACLKSITNIKDLGTVRSFQSDNVSGDSNDKLIFEAQIKYKVEKQYLKCLEIMEERFSHVMDVMAAQISLLDVLKSNAKTAVQFGYCRPKIDPTYDESSESSGEVSSYVIAKSLRHPIVEQINKRHKFIPNDIELGVNCKGLILHGTNDAGKTTLLKSIGLAVLQAQMGGFVPAKEFQFIPFHNVLTRLSGMDNMYKNQGSFAVEATELRDITERCTHKSLVLADELCRGTEHASAIGIVTGGIMLLNELNVNFVLATHLHDLIKLPQIKSLENRIHIKHLKVERDPTTNLLTYIRTLQDGPGDAYYGIEVARSQGVSEKILTVAEEIRKNYMDMAESLVVDKRSHFNRKKYMSYWCEVCTINRSQHIHHIGEQNTADTNGIIDNEYHKNDLFNLVSLCITCHDDIHDRHSLVIEGYTQTSEGTQLKWHRKSQKSKKLI